MINWKINRQASITKDWTYTYEPFKDKVISLWLWSEEEYNKMPNVEFTSYNRYVINFHRNVVFFILHELQKGIELESIFSKIPDLYLYSMNIEPLVKFPDGLILWL